MSHLTISFLTDETGPDHRAALAFAVAQRLSTVDIRSVGGVNFLSLDAAQQRAVAAEIRALGLTVGCLATPLLKWSPPGKAAATLGDQFGFDARGRSTEELFRAAFGAAALLGTRNLRIFTYLAYDGFAMADLAPDLGHLIAMAEERDCLLHIENEHVCNVATIADLVAVQAAFPHPRLRLLVDIPNAWRSGRAAIEAALPAAMRHADMLHFKDFSDRAGKCVALGEGDIPFASLWPAALRAAGGRPLTLTVETHVPAEQPGATRRSLAALRRLIA